MNTNKDTRSRQLKIVDNIERYIREKNIKKKDFCEKICISQSTFSKWKSETNNISLDYLDKTISVLDINSNDLFYSDEEKEKIVILSEKEKYSKIKTQKIINIKKTLPFLNLHIYTIPITLFISIVYLAISLVYLKESEFTLLISLLIFVFVWFIVGKVERKEEYIVNYLDDVYYKIEKCANQYRKKCITAKIISCIFTFINCFLIIPFIKVEKNENYFYLYFLFILLYFILSLIYTFYTPKQLKEEIYDHETSIYKNAFSFMIFSFVIIIIFISSSIQINNFSILGFVLLLVDLISRILNYIFVSKKFAEYKMVISDENGDIKKL